MLCLLNQIVLCFIEFRAPRFRGYQQQDSHELLRYLLDSMKTEEIKVGQKQLVMKVRLLLSYL